MKEDKDKCQEAGMDDYISKPFQLDDIAKVLVQISGAVVKEGNRKNQNGEQNVSSEVRQPESDAPVEEERPLSFNKEELLGRLGGHEDMLGIFINMFIRNVSGYLEELCTAMDTDNIEQVRVMAHTIKGAAANIAATRINETAKVLEQIVREGQKDDWRSNLKQLNDDFAEFKVCVGEYAAEQ